MALGKNLKKPAKSKPVGKKEKPAPVEPIVESVEKPDEDVPVLEETSQPEMEMELEEYEEDEFIEEIRPTVMMCVFKVADDEYAIPISLAKEVVRLKHMAPIPQMPPYIIGLANVRGTIYGVLDLAIYFDKSTVRAESGYLLVIKDEAFKIAVIIPNVPDTLPILEESIENINSSMLKSVKKREFLSGIIKKDGRMIVLLNILEMISGDNFITSQQQTAEKLQ